MKTVPIATSDRVFSKTRDNVEKNRSRGREGFFNNMTKPEQLIYIKDIILANKITALTAKGRNNLSDIDRTAYLIVVRNHWQKKVKLKRVKNYNGKYSGKTDDELIALAKKTVKTFHLKALTSARDKKKINGKEPTLSGLFSGLYGELARRGLEGEVLESKKRSLTDEKMRLLLQEHKDNGLGRRGDLNLADPSLYKHCKRKNEKLLDEFFPLLK